MMISSQEPFSNTEHTFEKGWPIPHHELFGKPIQDTLPSILIYDDMIWRYCIANVHNKTYLQQAFQSLMLLRTASLTNLSSWRLHKVIDCIAPAIAATPLAPILFLPRLLKLRKK